MRAATKMRRVGCVAPSPIRTLDDISVDEQPPGATWPPLLPPATGSGPAPSTVIITVRARSFLYHQVRLMATWLAQVGAGAREPEETRALLAARLVQAIRQEQGWPQRAACS